MNLVVALLVICFAERSFIQANLSSKPPDLKVEENVMKSKLGTTDPESVKREEEKISIDGMNVEQMKRVRETAQKHQFEAEVDRMMKLIINSLYKNKEIFLRELISNASDALDKIRFLSLTKPEELSALPDLNIYIKADKNSKTIEITDTGIGMTSSDMKNNLGTIAKSGTSDFIKKLSESTSNANDLIGQFGVGFYSAFLVSDRITVFSKHNDDTQHIWESDANSFSISSDPRGNTLKRGTKIVLHLKEEAEDFLEPDSLKNLVTKYSQFINFPIHVWTSRTETVEEPKEAKASDKKAEDAAKDAEKKTDAKKDDDATVEEEKDKTKAETKKVEKTVWDWEQVNKNKPIWTRKPAEIKAEEYNEFYKSFSKDSQNPLAKTHFTAEGEVTFKSILFLPAQAPYDLYSKPHKRSDNIKMYVKRVFITDDFSDMMPKYLNFIKGMVDSDDLPLNVSRETLQQHKLLKVIRKKLVRKTLDMIKNLSEEDFKKFWTEYSTSIKLGVIEDHSNRTRLSKLLRFYSSHSDDKHTSLTDYVSRMKEKQESIYFVAGKNKAEVRKSPFVESLLKKGYEVLYLVEPIDEYTMQSLTDFDGKKFQNVAKEGLKIDESAKAKERREALAKEFKPLLDWFSSNALKDKIEKAEISERLHSTPCALVAQSYGWSGNMERIMSAQAYQKSDDASTAYYSTQKRILEVNPRHPIIRELKRKVGESAEDAEAKNLALLLFDTATLRSGFTLSNSKSFADRIEMIMRSTLNISSDEKIEEDEEMKAAEEEKKKDTPVEDKEKVEEKTTDQKEKSTEKDAKKDEL